MTDSLAHKTDRSGTLRLVALAALLATPLVLASIYAPYLKALWMAATADIPAKTYPMPTKFGDGLAAVDDWFVVARIGPSTFAIGEPRYRQCNFAYLLVGQQRALLWDSGPGIRDISQVVSRLTKLPVIAMPSHLHFDHVGGLKYFPDVALPDVADLRARTTGRHLTLHSFEFLGLIEGVATPTLRVTQWAEPGSEIDLGGRKLRILPAPGHTVDSIVLLDETTGNMFTGDTLYPGNVWAFLPGTDLHAFRRSAIYLQSQTRPGASLFGGHGCPASETTLHVPIMKADTWSSLRSTLDRAIKPSLAIGFPRRIASTPPVTLESKAPWMAR